MNFKRLIAGVLFGTLLLTGCAYRNNDMVTDQTEKDKNALRVMTFNMRQGDGIDPEEQGQFVAQFKPDIVATQEVDKYTRRSPYDVSEQFAKAGKFKSYFFSKQVPYQGGEYGLAIFSNYDILAQEAVHIYSDEFLGDEALIEEQKIRFYELDPADPQTSKNYYDFCAELAELGKYSVEPNIIQKIVIEKDDKKVSIYGVHLSYENVEIRAKQHEQLLEILDKDKNEYKVIVGDFNNDQGHSELNKLRAQYNFANGKDGVWTETFSWEGDDASKCWSLDNIITTKNIEITNINYEATELSDHIAVYADLILK